jgi:hypothetical protein
MGMQFKHLNERAPDRVEVRGINVSHILGWIELGETPETIAEDYDLPLAAIYEALAYALDHMDEVRRFREENRKASRNHIPGRPDIERHLDELYERAGFLP